MAAPESQNDPESQNEVMAFLTELAGGTPIETHISLVFRGADCVWKLKKAVRLSFLDFSDLAAREKFCRRELALNAPAAPGLYRDVAAIVRRDDGGLALDPAPTGGAEILDWVLRMARVPEGNFLDHIAARGGLTPALLDAMADNVAAYHQALKPARTGDVGLRRVLAGNRAAALAAGLPSGRVEAWATRVDALLRGLDAWLVERQGAGFVRRAHGDLHLGNLCLWPSLGDRVQPVPFDALEFDEDLATIDLAYDLAFLLMDLDQRAGQSAANRVMNRYVARTGDAALVRGLPVFMSMRALIRAHVRGRSGDRGEADRYLDAAEHYLDPAPVMVVAIGGLPGTGKSTLARVVAAELGRAPGALVLRSDEIRKRLHGVAPETRLPDAAYAETMSARVFALLADTTRDAAAAGQCVIADATFLDPSHRAMIRAAAAPGRFVGIWLTAPITELERRILARRDDASDATVTVLHATAARGDTVPKGWTIIDASDPEIARERLYKALRNPDLPC